MPNRKHTSVVLDQELKRKLKAECEKTKEGQSTVIRRILKQHFDNDIVQQCGRQIIINIPGDLPATD